MHVEGGAFGATRFVSALTDSVRLLFWDLFWRRFVTYQIKCFLLVISLATPCYGSPKQAVKTGSSKFDNLHGMLPDNSLMDRHWGYSHKMVCCNR